PATFTGGVPFEALARLRRHTPVAWVPEIPVLGWPEGPGFWLVLRHADVESVLRRPDLFSSALGATQIRDPATPGALSYVRRITPGCGACSAGRSRRGRSPGSRTASAVTPGPSATACSPVRAANATSPRTWPPTCRCSPWPTYWACPSRTAGCC